MNAKRRLRGAILITAMMAAIPILAGCGVGGSDTSSGAPQQSGSYAGVTSQGLPISFTVRGDEILSVTYGWRASCADGQTHENSILLGGTTIQDGAFATGSRKLVTGGIGEFEGNFDGGDASGTLARSGGTAFGTDCEISGISWTAQAHPQSGPAASI